jgi:Zn-dependent protease
MFTSWKMGRVAGIDFYLHPTFLLILFYAGMFDGGVLAVGSIVAVFGCVLLHEMGHALMARRYGIETEDITLYPIGGVARLKRMPRSPGAELAIALAGPAVNVAIAGVLGIGWSLNLFGGPWDRSILGDFAMNLLLVNLVLAAFNLLPAFPMDGGRVLRALLSGWLGRVKATVIAASLGRGFALLLGVFGVHNLLQGNPMLLILSAFIYFVAGAELARVLDEERSREGSSDGIWTAPAGFRWVSRGKGVWQLAPITVQANRVNSPSWR